MASPNKREGTASRCRVAIVGCGPGGMFFCHHLAERRREYILAGKEELLDQLPQVTCFEKSHTHGGNWRADWVQSDSLWTNGVKEAIEFFDYTFADHFGKDSRLPVFVPRASILDYMTARVTNNAPDFFDRYVKFNTQVDKVTYNNETQLFTVRTTNLKTGEESEGMFEKCIWAAGECGPPNEPEALVNAFSGFQGLAVHSCRFRDWEKNAKGKHVVLIGGSYTALDMAYLAIKNKAAKVTLLVRNATRGTPVCWIERWPEDKVEVVKNMIPVGVNNSTQAIICGPSNGCSDGEEPHTLQGDKFEIESVDTVIFCTGYKASTEMMDESIYNKCDWNKFDEIEVPKEWTMKPHPLNDLLPDPPAPPPTKVYASDMIGISYAHHDCVMATNQNFFFPYAQVDSHILGIDITTYYILSVILGETAVPSMDDINEINRNVVLDAMQYPFLRGQVDSEYNKALEQLYWNKSESVDFTDWFREQTFFQMRMLGQKGRDCNYPVDLGGMNGISEVGKALSLYDELAYLPHEKNRNVSAGTIHDIPDHLCAKIKSIHTGNRCFPLKQRWMQLDHTISPLDMVEGNKQLLELDKERWNVMDREVNPIDGPL